MKLTFKILTRHIGIGALITLIVFWAMGELPYLSDISDRLWIWLLIPIIILLVIWTTTKPIFNLVTKRTINRYAISVIFIIGIWLTLFFSTAILEGINGSVKSGKSEILDYIEGFLIYRLWVYLGLGIFHALMGGIFLTMDLRKLQKSNLRVD